MIFQHGTFYSKVPYEFGTKCRRKQAVWIRAFEEKRATCVGSSSLAFGSNRRLDFRSPRTSISIKVSTIDSHDMQRRFSEGR